MIGKYEVKSDLRFKSFLTKENTLLFLFSFLTGAAILVMFSFFQKIIAGFNPYILKAYFVPFFFGGTTGFLVGSYIIYVNHSKQQIHLREEYLSATLHSIGEGVITCSQDCVVTGMNRVAEEITGWKSEEAEGQPVKDIFKLSGSDTLEGSDYFSHCSLKQDGGSRPAEKGILITRNQDEKRVSFNCSVIEGKDNSRKGCVLIFSDITDEYLQREQLRKAKEEAELANRAKSEFLANMSHEIRTPMNGVIGMTSLLADTNLDEDQREYLDYVRVSAKNMMKIINDILDIAKLESGKIDLEICEFSLDKMLENISAMVFCSAHKKGLEIVSYIDKKIPEYLLGDELKIRQILTNLTGNALKFTKEGSILIEVKLKNQTEQLYDLEFSVKDTGVGIKGEMKPKLFKPFVQGDLTSTKEYQGTGLGLAISKQLVEIMGGTIDYQSDPGKGSRFYFNVRLKQSDKLLHHVEEMDIDFKKLKILFIDDNALNRKITGKILSEEGADVILAESGMQGMQQLEANQEIDVILLDVHMPWIDGYETLKLIEEKYGHRYTILMYSSIDLRDILNDMKDHGAADYLMKPVGRKSLLKKIKKALNSKFAEQMEKDLKSTAGNLVTKDGLKASILVVEDNEINRQLMKKTLARIGDYNIYTAKNGEEAVASFLENRQEIIFMDIQLPVMNGLAAFKQIMKLCRDKAFRRPFVVAMTAYAMKGDCEKFLSEGMDFYLSKPFEAEEVREIVGKASVH